MISTIAGLVLIGLAQAPAQPAAAPLPPPGRMTPARAKADLGALIGDEDYPRDALRHEQEGTVGFRLNVGLDGLVSGCTVTSSSGSPSLDQATCRLLTERARFTPARDVNGRPATDTVSARIVWRIDRSGPPEPIKRVMLVSGLKVTAAGEMTCWRIEVGRVKPDRCPSPSRLPDIARAAGKPMEQTMILTVTPEGDEEPTYPGDHGEMWLNSEALLTIAPDGSQLDCRVVRSEDPSALAAAPLAYDPCGSIRPGTNKFEPAPKGAGPRVLRLKVKGYSRF